MMLPLLATPFLTMIFWALGGGKGTVAHTRTTERAGLNPGLPDAHFKSERNAWDKLSLYEQARRDSLKFREARRTDPYVKLDPMKGTADSIPEAGRMNPTLGRKDRSMDDADLAQHKINELYKAIQGSSAPNVNPGKEHVAPPVHTSSISDDVRNLEMMMEMMQASGNENRELAEMQDVLEKILDVQHPERVKERIREQSRQRPRYAHGVSTSDEQPVGLLGKQVFPDSVFQHHSFFDEYNGFFGLGEEVRLSDSRRRSIPAVIHQDQSLVSGAVVKLRLTHGVVVDGFEISEGSFVFGQCALNGERLIISISTIHAEGRILPVSLSAYDVDGMEGLHIPGAISRDVLKQSSDQAVQGLQLSPLNTSIELQAAGAGIETAKNLLSRKSRLVTVTVKAGHKVILVDTNQNYNH